MLFLRFETAFQISNVILIQNSRGNLKQFVTGDFYSEMFEKIEKLFQSGQVSEKCFKRFKRLKNKKFIPYSVYLSDCSEYQKILKY